jgi:hypothetical protein
MDSNSLRYFSRMNYEVSTEFGEDPADQFDKEQMQILHNAVDKLIRFGELVGVNAEEMVLLLDSGMTVRGLLYYLVSQSSPVN